MAMISVVPKFVSYVFTPYVPRIAAHVKPGDKVIVYTLDAFSNRIHQEDDLPSKVLPPNAYFNPQTGPIYIEGAEPGDTLSVYIERIEPLRDYAVSCFIPYLGGLTSTPLTRTLQEPLPEKVWIWRLETNNHKYFLYNDEIGVEVPWDPLMGCLAVAPEIEAVSTIVPGPFGGNMDVPDVRPGNTVYLPVFHRGALLFTGDCHANQGQGELCGIALEIPCKVTLRFGIIKKSIQWPRIESEKSIMVVGSARPMEDAARIAYAELALWMEEEFGFTRWEAYELLTQVGGLYVGNMVAPAYSLVASIAKRYLKRI